MNKREIKFILSSFFIWRILLFLFLFVAVSVVALQKNFLGGGLTSYLKAPYFWAWANFDGEHYLSLAYQGYQPLTYFFFPLYPLLTRFVGMLLGGSFTSLAVSGLLVSHTAFLIGLIGLIKLIRLDFRKEIAYTTVVLLLLFPTSFYFGSVYTESLFLALVVWCFYFARKRKWIYSGVLGALATATRLVGIALLPAILIEVWEQRRNRGSRDIGGIWEYLGAIFIPMGLFAYMLFLKNQTGDPLEFIHNVGIYGPQRSSTLVLLPQVFYRYLFKILPNINYDYFPVVFTTLLEFITAIVFGVLGVLGFKKFRLSYATYLVLGYLIPTLSGSFSSLPRYVIVLFPAFILGSLYFVKLSKISKIVLVGIFLICLGIATALFTRGYWVS